MTNWVTIKIPEEIRDDAREDSRTYAEIMQAGLKEEHNSLDAEREELIEDIREQLEGLEDAKNEISMANEPGVEVDVERIIKRIDDLENNLPVEVAREIQQ